MRYLSLASVVSLGSVVSLAAVCVGLVATTDSARAAAPPGPGVAHGFLTAPPGAPGKPGVTKPMTYFHDGLNVWVNSRADNRGKIVIATRNAVNQLRRYGVRIHYKGIAQNRAVEKGTHGALGIVRVTSLPAHDRACGRPKRGGSERGGRVSFPAVARYPGLGEIETANVKLCSGLFRQPNSTAVTLHEFGHVVGLGDISAKYHGKKQVMQVSGLLPTRYQAGDRNGLSYVNYQSRALARPVPLQGRIRPLSLHAGHVRVHGWVITGRATTAGRVSVTVDGQAVAPQGYRRTSRPDLAKRFHVLNSKSGFRFSIAAGRGKHVYCVYASEPTGGPRARLGCDTITFAQPPPASPPVSSTAAHPSPASSAASSAPALPGAGTAGSSGPNLDLIAGIAGGIVVVGLGVLLFHNRRRRPVPAAPLPEPMQFWPTLPVETALPATEHLGRAPAPPPPAPPPPGTRPPQVPPPQLWTPQPPPPSREDRP